LWLKPCELESFLSKNLPQIFTEKATDLPAAGRFSQIYLRAFVSFAAKILRACELPSLQKATSSVLPLENHIDT
jgi:hypothetical protein